MSNTNTAKAMIKSLPSRYKHDPTNINSEAIFHFYISGKNGGDFTIQIEGDECLVYEDIRGDSDCDIKCSDTVYEELEKGVLNAQIAFLTGKLTVSNAMAAMKFLNNFERLS